MDRQVKEYNCGRNKKIPHAVGYKASQRREEMTALPARV